MVNVVFGEGPAAGLDPSIEQDSDAEFGQCCLFLEATQATPSTRELHIALFAHVTRDVCVLSTVIKYNDVIANVVSSLT